MSTLLQPATLAWLAMMLATALSTWGLSGSGAPGAAVPGILLIAAIKLHLVLDHFMELRHAPLPWRLGLGLWVLAVTGGVLGIYLGAAAA